MENEPVKAGYHKLVLTDRSSLSLTGIEKVESLNETTAECKTGGKFMVIQGANLQVLKLDVEHGILELSGRVDCIKYADDKKSLLKRLFK